MKSIFVKRHVRKTKTPEAQVRVAENTLRRMGADRDLDHVCHVTISPEASQVFPAPGADEFVRDHCVIVNIGPIDMDDEVECAATLQHEAVHARQIAERGEDGVSRHEHEIAAHRETIVFLKKWKRKDRRAYIQKRVPEVVEEEKETIRILKREAEIEQGGRLHAPPALYDQRRRN